jgi:hypothetical protein
VDGASDDLHRLRDALAEFVADDVSGLLAEARSEARTRVRTILAEVMAESMLEQARREAGAGEPSPRPPRPRQRTEPPERAHPVRRVEATRPPRPDGSSSATDARDDALGYYVYGVMATDGAVPSELAGVDPAHAAAALAGADLAALVSRVPLAEFNEERLREHLGDIAWVETMARRHEQVLEAAAAHGTVIPMRLCSIYRDAAGVRAMLERESGPMHDALRLLDARSEWGVKLFSVPVPESPAPDAKEHSPGSGAAYLEQRHQAHRRRESAAEKLTGVAESIHARLGALAARALVIPPQRPEVSGHAGEMVLNGVYLIDDAALTSFHETVGALQDEFGAGGVELVATGPWPPYNFVPDAIGVPA